MKEPGKSVSPVCTSIDGETRTQKSVTLSPMPCSPVGEWSLQRTGGNWNCEFGLHARQHMWSSQTVWVWCHDSMYRLKKRWSEMLNYFPEAAQLLGVNVRIGAQVCSDSKLSLHWLDLIRAVIFGEKLHTGPLVHGGKKNNSGLDDSLN